MTALPRPHPVGIGRRGISRAVTHHHMRVYTVSWGVTCAFSLDVEAKSMAEAKKKAKEVIERTHEVSVYAEDKDAALDDVFLDKVMVQRR